MKTVPYRAWWAASVVLLVLPVLGEFSPGFALLQMFTGCLALPFTIACVVLAFREKRVLFALVPALISFPLSSRVTLGVPHYVKTNAAPFIEQVEAWKVAHGEYPPEALPDELRALLRSSGCDLYGPKGESFSVTCRGVVFTKCTYDGATKDWYGWD